MGKLKDQLKSIINISSFIDISSANNNIRKNIDFRGPNVWILAFAVVIASVGLNVNSIPVIIGAMLISPLMGPVIGLGLGLGTNDTGLLKYSLRHLGVMVAISIIASSLYFILSPLEMENPTELLARTNPTIFDVIIALFGGFAGIIEISRKDKGTVFSGVAIATALMPPLCTIGYGIASLNITYILGALYLFFINCVFIALATYVAVRYLKFPTVQLSDPVKQKKLTRNISLFTLILIIPSIWSAIVVIQENTFNQNAKKFIEENKSINKSYIYDYKIEHGKRKGTIEISIAGEALTKEDKNLLYKSLEYHGINSERLSIKESAVINRDDLSEKEMIQSIFDRNDKEIKKREELLDQMDKELRTFKEKELPAKQIAKELTYQYPDMIYFSIARGTTVNLTTFKEEEQIIVLVKWETPVNNTTLQKLEKWLSARLEFNNLTVIQKP